MGYPLTFNGKEFLLRRYPETSQSSLRPFSNAELLVLREVKEKISTEDIHLFNDRFGIWNCALHQANLTTIWNYASQKKAVMQNLERNRLPYTPNTFKTPLDRLKSVGLALIKVPKSTALFELFLRQIHLASDQHTEVVCGLMTKYFNPSLLIIASMYFEEVSQSLAWKKARLLILKNPKKKMLRNELINTISWKNHIFKQYFGVFSSGKIDLGTQFLLKNLNIKADEAQILDLGSGNGIIAWEASRLNPKAQLTLIDDSILAIASSTQNVKNAHFLCDDILTQLPLRHFDLVLSNPPFHFEHEHNIEVSLNLFKQVRSCLKPNGRFILVANKHLNYTTHLQRMFTKVSQLKCNRRFEVLECTDYL